MIADPWFWALALPALALTGISKGALGGGALTFRHLSEHWIRILLGVVSLGFLAWSYYPRKRLGAKPPPAAAGWFWGTLSGFTSFVTHAGGPPIMVYLLPLRLEKAAFVATSLVFFAALNYAKILPYVWLGLFDALVLSTSLVLIPLGIAGIFLGVWLQRRIDTRWFYRIIYVLLFVAGIRLLFDGITGL